MEHAQVQVMNFRFKISKLVLHMQLCYQHINNTGNPINSEGCSSANGNSFPTEQECCLPSCICGGSASLERGFVTGFAHPDEPSCNPHSNGSFIIITDQEQHDIQMNEECDEEDPYL